MKAGQHLSILFTTSLMLVYLVGHGDSQIFLSDATLATALGFGGVAGVVGASSVLGFASGKLVGNFLNGGRNRYGYSQRRGKRQLDDNLEFELKKVENFEECLNRFYCELALTEEENLLPVQKSLLTFVKSTTSGQNSPGGKIVAMLKPGDDDLTICQKRYKNCRPSSFEALMASIERAV